MQYDLFNRRNIPKHLTIECRKYIEKNMFHMSGASIARKLGFSANCIISELRRNGGKNNYNADKAQQRSICMKDMQHEKLRDKNKEYTGRLINVEKQLKIVQMQLEIVLDYINGAHK